MYFEEVTAEVRSKYDGFECVRILDLPRATESDHQKYLTALMQGMTDGTIAAGKDRRESCEMEMRARGMLIGKSSTSGLSDLRVAELTDVLAKFGEGSRHTLHNTTNQDPASVEKFLRQTARRELTVEQKPGKVRPKFKRMFAKET